VLIHGLWRLVAGRPRPLALAMRAAAGWDNAGKSVRFAEEAVMPTRTRFTSADLKLLPDLPGVHYEIIDGELHGSRQPTLGHQDAGGVVYAALLDWSQQTGLGRPFFTPGLVFAEDQDVIPDVVWISRARLAEAQDEHGHLRLAPELVVEVLSPGRANELRDRDLKLDLYRRRGVEEYWIVDWQRNSVQVYRRDGDMLPLVATLGHADGLTSPLLPGFTCPVARVWEIATP
jgi:Uma2 family endonuclease